jgi:hypothetical protein
MPCVGVCEWIRHERRYAVISEVTRILSLFFGGSSATGQASPPARSTRALVFHQFVFRRRNDIEETTKPSP